MRDIWKGRCVPIVSDEVPTADSKIGRSEYLKRQALKKDVTFACVGDLHMDIRPIQKLIEEVELFDAVLVAGDTSHLGSDYEIESMCFHLNRIGKPVFIIAGNHDIQFEKDKKYGKKIESMYNNITYLKDSYVEFKSIKIYGTPYVLDTPSWAFSLDDDSMAEHLPSLEVDILLSHNPPSLPVISTEITAFGVRDYGFKSMRSYLEKVQPQYCVCGHVHAGGGANMPIENTQVVNASYGISMIHVGAR